MRKTLPIFLLLALVAGSWWLLNPSEQQDIDTAAEAFEDGYYLIDAEISNTNNEGVAQYQLKAKRIDHNPADDSITLQKLELIYDTQSRQHWLITATEGWLDGNRDRMILDGNVLLNGINSDGEQTNDTTIATERLTLSIKDNTASTTRQVNIRTSGGELNADGLQADLENQKINLLSNVRGTFTPIL